VACSYRWYAGAVEARALADLQDVAVAANAAGTLPPSGRALLTVQLDEDSGLLDKREGGPSSPAMKSSNESSNNRASWPTLIKREFAVKLNNLQETSVRTEALARKLAQYLMWAEDPLREDRAHMKAASSNVRSGALHEPVRSVSPELGIAVKGSARAWARRSRTSIKMDGVPMRGSMEQVAVAAEMKASQSLKSELTFMSDGFGTPQGSAPGIEEDLLV
jgi:hypothetical protein